MELQKYTELANECRVIGSEIDAEPLHGIIQKISDGVRLVSRSASNSWLGYHANVYYKNFKIPAPGDHFDPGWGLRRAMFDSGTSTQWREYDFDDVENEIMRISEKPNVNALEVRAHEVASIFNARRSSLVAMLSVALERNKSDQLEELRNKAKKLTPMLSEEKLINAAMPSGSIMSRDELALSQQLRTPPHVSIMCKVASLRTAFTQISELGNIAEAAANYLREKFSQAKAGILADGTIFIGHGRSQDWWELSAFIGDRLKLKWDEFNREPTAGLSIKERLESMLDHANFAFLIMTAEDEHADKTIHARENVVHEIGLFQGRLGFNRAIVLLEDGCQEFSNINGIIQIRYPKGKIKAKYEDIRCVLERESILST